MKKLLFLLGISLILTGCGTQAPPAAEPAISTAAVEATEAAPTEAPPSEYILPLETFPTEEPELSYDAYRVVYNILTDSQEESAQFQGIGPEGELVWTYETQSYPMAQLGRITPVGQWQDHYYLIEDGTVLCLNIITGELLFENADFGGSPCPEAMAIDEYGYLYLAGYDGPDFFAMDAQGHTVKRIASLSEEFMRPIRISLEGDELTVYMESDRSGNSGHFPCTLPMGWLPQAKG